MYAEPPPPQHPLTCWQLTSGDGTHKKLELARFAAMSGLERAAPGRVGTLLRMQLHAGVTAGTLNPAKRIGEGGTAQFQWFDRSTLFSRWHTTKPLFIDFGTEHGFW